MIFRESVETRLRERGLDPRWEGSPPAGFAGLALDSRSAGPGDLFCAVVGGRADAHAFVGAAARAGAAAAVVQRRVEGSGLPLLHVRDTRSAASHLAALFRGDPAADLHLVGITGTNGKTTTAWIARHLLADLGPAAALGTLGMVGPDGVVEPGTLTTPDPLDLMDALADLRDAGVESVAMEVSSHGLDQRRADALRFAAAVFTSFSREHLDYHPDMEEYLAAKLRLVRLVSPDGVCLVNDDEPAWEGVRELAGSLPRRVAGFGLGERVDVRAVDVRADPGGSHFRLTCPAGEAEVDLPLPGEFNVHNALGAAAVALEAGLSPGRVAELLSAAPPVPGRMEVLRREPSVVIRDYAHTPDSYRRVLGGLRPRVRGRLFVVFGCGGDRDPGKRPEMGRIATEIADLTFVTTDNPRSEDPAEIARQVVRDLDPARYEVVLDRREAIGRALERAGPEDVVLLLGKGHETYQAIGDRKEPFDEARIVAELTAGARDVAGAGREP